MLGKLPPSGLQNSYELGGRLSPPIVGSVPVVPGLHDLQYTTQRVSRAFFFISTSSV